MTKCQSFSRNQQQVLQTTNGLEICTRNNVTRVIIITGTEAVIMGIKEQYAIATAHKARPAKLLLAVKEAGVGSYNS